MTELTHKQIVRVKGFSPYASKITVGTARGFASQYQEDAEAAHARTLANGNDTAWLTQEAAVISSDYKGKSEALDSQAAAISAAVEIEDGQIVSIEGERFRVIVTGERYSDPVHFRRI